MNTNVMLTFKSFKVRAQKVHGDKYSYRDADWSGLKGTCTIRCKRCRTVFSQKVEVHLRGSGCAQCKKAEKTEERKQAFLDSAKKIHAGKYLYGEVHYVGVKTPVKIFCKACKTHFMQTPAMHVGLKRGCRTCGGAAKSTKTEFAEKAKRIHGELYDYGKVIYTNAKTKVVIGCTECGKDFEQIPNSHLNGSGCPHCQTTGYSKIAVKWLEYESKKRRIKIQHAANVGEYRIPGTNLYADGFHPKSNTIFEFYGDCYHGNPNVYRPMDKPNPYSDKTARQMHKETMQRERYLKSLGYTVVSIWQSDFRELRRTGHIRL